MATIQLVGFLLESAEELIVKAESALPALAGEKLDEAEELLALGARIMSRHKAEVISKKEAA